MLLKASVIVDSNPRHAIPTISQFSLWSVLGALSRSQREVRAGVYTST
jgi:hypothetical protein